MTNYDRGRRLEYDARTFLTENGYDVIRSAGSKSAVDLVAFKRGQTLLVQAKLRGVLPPKERDELLRIASLIDAIPLLVQRPRATFYKLTGHGARDREPWSPDLTERTPA